MSPQQVFPHSCTHAALKSHFNLSLTCAGRGDEGITLTVFIISLLSFAVVVFLPMVKKPQ